MTWPIPTVRPARATWGRAAAGTTASSSRAGPRPARPTAPSPGPAPPAGPGPGPSQPQPPAPAVRTLPTPDPLDELSPTYADDELWELLDRPDDPTGYELRALDAEPDDVDDAGDLLREGDTRCTLDLTDPYAWTDPARLE